MSEERTRRERWLEIAAEAEALLARAERAESALAKSAADALSSEGQWHDVLAEAERKRAAKVAVLVEAIREGMLLYRLGRDCNVERAMAVHDRMSAALSSLDPAAERIVARLKAAEAVADAIDEVWRMEEEGDISVEALHAARDRFRECLKAWRALSEPAPEQSEQDGGAR